MDNDFNGDELQEAIDAITKDAANGEASSMADEMVEKNKQSAAAGKVISASTDMGDGQSVFGPAPEPAVPPVTDMNAPVVDNAAEETPIAGPEVAPAETTSSEESKTESTAPVAETPVAQAPAAEAPAAPAPEAQPAEKEEALATEVQPEVAASDVSAAPAGDFEKVREEALRAIYPVLEKVVSDPKEKYNTYKEIFGLMRNADVAESLLKTAESFTDEQEKANALLELLKLIGEVK